ncbi:unnamed protein product [Cyprideis torosa]|uniref:Uncharacterized protein n=1 Tax=Cyprideis torosa TaxID=163714 RepID=A0A7R8WKR3_9CRUS|nr:unnamed protein product [Cyprideis torosa]CAG0903493.1 unnamed protein product [Cyprideis torosa]
MEERESGKYLSERVLWDTEDSDEMASMSKEARDHRWPDEAQEFEEEDEIVGPKVEVNLKSLFDDDDGDKKR